ncbi:ArgS-related anticodon-binding protein NrtL [Streptomyces sp. NPDC001292]|uniref:ArgS-related anticodon-binding protein NrtL n=1 Tax=Streptomyces sp. NPDC001292 TaxID=3364558 RepID=UPI0036889E5C
MTPVELSRTVLSAVRRAVDVGELSVSVPERVVVTPPRPGGCGDYATNIALQLARPAGQPAPLVAQVLRGHLLGLDGIDDVAVTGPGFLNISLRDADAEAALVRLVDDVRRSGGRYGYVPRPTGVPRSTGAVVELRCAGEVRAVVVADVVARLLRSQGESARVSCTSPLPADWQRILGLGAHVDAPSDALPGVGVRPVPVPADALPGVGVRPVPGPADPLPGVDIRPVPAPADPLPLGRDAARWALLHPAGHDRPRIGDEHLVQRESNPLFRVRYAHARTRALGRNAADLGFDAEAGPVDVAPSELVTLLANHPRVLARAADHRAPDVLARHLVSVADAVLPFLATVLPCGEEKPSAAHRARLALAEAAGTVLAGGLSLLGIDAPEHL